MKNLNYTDCKELLNMTDRESVEAFINEEDYSNTTYRIMEESEALKEVINMYEGDAYMLGCFNASFVEDFISLDYEDIKILQDGEQFEIIGKLILNSDNLEEMMEEYIRLDGWGHALNSYDGNYEEYNNLIIFRQN